MDNVDADFIIQNDNPIQAEFELNESEHFDCSFTILANPEKISQLENDLNFQTGEQVDTSINAASAVINERIDGVVEAFDNEIEDINERMIDTIEGSELIGVSRTDNTVILISQTFVFEQGIVSDTWVINHDLNKRPSIELVDSSGRKFEAEVEYINENQIVVHLNSATTGYAYLN